MATTLWTTSSRRRPLLPVLGLCLATLACVGPSAPGPKAQWGAATGAAAGGLLGASAGHHPEAIVAGVLIGGLLGGALGNALDNADREYAARSAYTALEYQRRVLLPRVHPDHHRGRPHAARLRHRLPPARR
jgi:surface antigen